MIPANIDYLAIVRELNEKGILNHKIEMICGFSQGYINHMQAGIYRDMTYQRAARLYNFWWDECQANRPRALAMFVPLFEKNQHLAATT